MSVATSKPPADPPFAVGQWYPAIRGASRGVRFLSARDAGDPAILRSAWEALAPGTALAIAGSISAGSGRIARLGRAPAARRWLSRLDAPARVDRWFVFPNTGGSHVLLPVGRRGFRAGLCLLPAGRRRWRVVRWILGRVARLGMVGRLGLEELVVAVKGTAEAPALPWLAEEMETEVTVALGVPGLFRKAIVLVSGKDGAVRGLLKLSLTRASRAQVHHEIETLRTGPGVDFPASAAPTLLGHGEGEHGAWLAQSFLAGRRSPDAIGTAHLDFLAEMHRRTARHLPLEEMEVFRAIRTRLETDAPAADARWVSAMVGLRDALLHGLAGRSLPCGRSHGDFTPWNLVLDDGRLAAFDWEFSREEVPALFDLVHFQFQTGVLVHHLGAVGLLAELDTLLAGPARDFVRELGLDALRTLASTALYVLFISTFDEHLHRIERPPFVQVEWLREARIELAHLLAARLREHGAHHALPTGRAA